MRKYAFDRKDTWWVLVILFLAIAFRVIYFFDYEDTPAYPLLSHSDSYEYYVWAKDIASGDAGEKAFVKWPFYAYFLGCIFKFFGDNLSSIYALQFIFGAANCVLVYLIGRIIFNRMTGFIAALLCVWYGLFLLYDGLLMYTSLSLLCNSLFFLCVLRLQDNPLKQNLFWPGLFLGVCTLIQPNIALFGILAVIWILQRDKLRWRKSIYSFLCFIAGFGIVIGSVTLRNYLTEKDFVLIADNTGFNFYLGNNPRATGDFYPPYELTLNQEDMLRDARVIAMANTGRKLKTSEVSRYWLRKGMGFIRESPFDSLTLFLKKTIYLLEGAEHIHDMEYYYIKGHIRLFKILFMDLRVILPLAFLGMLLGVRKIRETALLYGAIGTLAFSIVIFFVTNRYRIMLVPYLSIFAGSAIFSLWSAFAAKRYFKFALLLAVAVPLFLVYNNSWAQRHRQAGPASVLSSLDAHLIRGMMYEKKADYQSAIRELTFAESIQPDNQRAAFRLGVVYFRLHKFTLAEENFKKVIARNPLSLDSYYNLGVIYNQQQRFAEARDMLRQAIFLDPDDEKAHFELGAAYRSLGEFKKAKDEFSIVLKRIKPWRKADRDIVEQELAAL